MPRPRPPHLHKQTTRHGKIVWYVRIDRGPRIRVLGDYGSPEFKAAYNAAISGAMPSKPLRKAGVGTLKWAVDMYRQSSSWLALSKATRRQRENIFRRIVEVSGNQKFADVNRASIVAVRESRAATPAAARHFVETMRGLFAWAVESDLVSVDPTQGVKVKKPKTEGHPVWTDDDIAAYERRWPVGTRERVAFDILLYTGLRRGDAVLLGRQHVKDGVARIATEKTGELVVIVIAPALARTLAAGPCGDLAFIAGDRGAPRVKEAFGNWFAAACRAAGVKKSAHGLRKAAATRAANNGASEAELEAMFGWRGGRMASLYTRSADRERLSIGAAEKLSKRKP